MSSLERVDLGEIPYRPVSSSTTWWSTCGHTGPADVVRWLEDGEDVTMTSLAGIARRRGVRIPTDGEVRDAVAAALGAIVGTTPGARPASGHRDGSIAR